MMSGWFGILRQRDGITADAMMRRSGQWSSVGSDCFHLMSLLLCVSTLPPSIVGISPECKFYLQFVAQSSSRFEVCALLNARPFTVCSDCFEDYGSAYNTIVDLKNGRGPVQKNCSEDLLSGDRVSIINRAFTYLTETWNSGNCDNCLVVTRKDNQVFYKLAESTKEFRRRADQVSECIDSRLRNNTKVCIECQSPLSNLTQLYNELVKKYEGNLCMDIIDKMNTTRVEWAGYGCSHLYGLDVEVCLYAGAMVTITIIFYFVARFSQTPRDAVIIEGRTMRDHFFKMSEESNSVHSQRELILPAQRQRSGELMDNPS